MGFYTGTAMEGYNCVSAFPWMVRSLHLTLNNARYPATKCSYCVCVCSFAGHIFLYCMQQTGPDGCLTHCGQGIVQTILHILQWDKSEEVNWIFLNYRLRSEWQGSNRSLFPGKVLTFEHGSLRTGKVLSFNRVCKKVQDQTEQNPWT